MKCQEREFRRHRGLPVSSGRDFVAPRGGRFPGCGESQRDSPQIPQMWVGNYPLLLPSDLPENPQCSWRALGEWCAIATRRAGRARRSRRATHRRAGRARRPRHATLRRAGRARRPRHATHRRAGRARRPRHSTLRRAGRARHLHRGGGHGPPYQTATRDAGRARRPRHATLRRAGRARHLHRGGGHGPPYQTATRDAGRARRFPTRRTPPRTHDGRCLRPNPGDRRHARDSGGRWNTANPPRGRRGRA